MLHVLNNDYPRVDVPCGGLHWDPFSTDEDICRAITSSQLASWETYRETARFGFRIPLLAMPELAKNLDDELFLYVTVQRSEEFPRSGC